MKKLAWICLALALGACAKYDAWVSGSGSGLAGSINATATAINAVDAAYNSDANVAARNALQAGATAVVCQVADAAATVAVLTKALGNSTHGTVVAVRDATSVYVAASTICKQAGGTVIGVTAVPATAIATGT
jgi:hypothetical protein